MNKLKCLFESHIITVFQSVGGYQSAKSHILLLICMALNPEQVIIIPNTYNLYHSVN